MEKITTMKLKIFTRTILLTLLVLLVARCEDKNADILDNTIFSSKTITKTTVIDYSVYKSDSLKINMYYDDFNDSASSANYGWVFGNWTDSLIYHITTSINNSNFIYNYNRPNYIDYEYLSAKNLEYNSNFEIESSIKIDSGGGSSEAGMIWGVTKGVINSDSIYYTFFFTQTGYYYIKKSYYSNNNGDYSHHWETLGSSSSSLSYINTTGYYNKLTIRKINNIYYFFINETLVYTDSNGDISTNSDYFGFLVGRAIMYADYISVDQL